MHNAQDFVSKQLINDGHHSTNSATAKEDKKYHQEIGID